MLCLCCSIDGLRLEYETDLGSIFQEERDDKTATKLENDFTGLNNLPQLCRLMLRAHGVQQSLWFAHVRSSFMPLRMRSKSFSHSIVLVLRS